jgi:biotin-(acetyl-CoA carboxylase) ligase
VQLKWPNDVLKDGDKLAGILVETQVAVDGAAWAIIGIGVNLVMPDALEDRIGRSAAAMPWLARMDRDELMAALLDGLAEALRAVRARGLRRLRRALEPAARMAGPAGRACSTAARSCTKASPPASTMRAACCSTRRPADA